MILPSRRLLGRHQGFAQLIINSLNIKTKLYIGFGILLALLLFMAGLSFWGLQSLTAMTTRMSRIEAQVAEQAGHVRAHALNLRRFEKDYFLNIGSKEAQGEYYLRWTNEKNQLLRSLTALEDIIPELEEGDMVKRMQSDLHHYLSAFEHVRLLIDSRKLKTPQEANNSIAFAKNYIRAIDGDAIYLGDFARKRMESVERESQTTRSHILLLVVVLGIVAVVLALLVSSFITKSITAQQEVLDRTRESLRKREALFRAVVEKSSEALVISGDDGIISYASPPTTVNFGHTPEELVGHPWGLFVYHEDREIVAAAGQWVREHPGRTKRIIARLRHKENRWRWIEIIVRNHLNDPDIGAIVSNLRDITEQREAEHALIESEYKFRDLVEQAVVGVYLIQNGLLMYANKKCAEIHGYEDPALMEGMQIEKAIFPEDYFPLHPKDGMETDSHNGHSRQFRIVRKDGDIRYVETFGRHTTFQDAQATIGMIIDVTDKKQTEEALRWKTTFLEALVYSSNDGILILDSHAQSVLQNRRLEDLWKMPHHIAQNNDEQKRIGFLLGVLKDGKGFSKKLAHLIDHPDDSIHLEVELKDGTVLDTISYPVINEEQRYGRIWTFRDITESRRYWDMLENLSTTDGLTDLFNRRRFDEYFDHEWRRSMRDEKPIALVIMDVDYFKLFNDRYGHLAGDDCLKQVAHVLKHSTRRSSDLAARYGGEEFACVLPGTDLDEAIALAESIRQKISDLGIPHDYSPVTDHVTISCGVAATVPQRNQDRTTLILKADRCLYMAKEQGRNRVINFDTNPEFTNS
jgi:diguanylate cyclase (GGDEF)-like protein/PAS domain S-box-containing protein